MYSQPGGAVRSSIVYATETDDPGLIPSSAGNTKVLATFLRIVTQYAFCWLEKGFGQEFFILDVCLQQ
jgi:hypothetical protein